VMAASLMYSMEAVPRSEIEGFMVRLNLFLSVCAVVIDLCQLAIYRNRQG
jgi:hypothetical protein